MKQETNQSTNQGHEANTMLAAVLVRAVKDDDWAAMLTIFPKGVEHRTYKYDRPEHFIEWDTYEGHSRYVVPAQNMLRVLCLNKALELLVNGS